MRPQPRPGPRRRRDVRAPGISHLGRDDPPAGDGHLGPAVAAGRELAALQHVLSPFAGMSQIRFVGSTLRSALSAPAIGTPRDLQIAVPACHASMRRRSGELADLPAAGFSGANARVDARSSMKSEALPRCGSDRERRGCAADAAAGPVSARPNFFRTCLPPRDVVDRATERLNLPRFRAICTAAYRSPPAQDCLSRRRSPVRIRLGVSLSLNAWKTDPFRASAGDRQ